MTAVGHTQLPQYPPRLAAPVESVRPLVETVAAPLIGAGPASAGVRLDYHHRLTGPGRGCGSRQTGQPRPDHHYGIPVMFWHADMTPAPM
jgi:hypothetical protein